MCAVNLSVAQEADTTEDHSYEDLKHAVDSLQGEFIKLRKEFEKYGKKMSAIDHLIPTLEDEEAEAVSDDQRSRRKSVDALLDAISQQPGHLRFNGMATATVQYKPGEDDFTTGVGSFDIFAHTALGSHTLLFVDIEAIAGNGPSSRIPAFTSLNEDVGGGPTQDEDGIDRLRVLEAWGEFSVLDKALVMTVGKIDLTNYFDNNAFANDETSQFISGAFVNSLAFPVPSNSPGFRFRTAVRKRLFLQFGIGSINNSPDSLFKEIFKIAGLGYSVLRNTDWEANLRVYGYLHPAADNHGGIGLSFDEAIAGTFNVFARYTKNSKELAQWSGMDQAWSAGIRFTKQLAKRKLTVSAAFGKSMPEADELNEERLIEIYVRRQLNRWIYVSPHVQLVQNAAGTEEEYLILGFRTHFNF